MFKLFAEAGIVKRDDQVAYLQRVLHGNVSSSKELTGSEAAWVIDELEAEVLSNPRRTFEAARARKAVRRLAEGMIRNARVTHPPPA
jgi:hypothetical protein